MPTLVYKEDIPTSYLFIYFHLATRKISSPASLRTLPRPFHLRHEKLPLARIVRIYEKVKKKFRNSISTRNAPATFAPQRTKITAYHLKKKYPKRPPKSKRRAPTSKKSLPTRKRIAPEVQNYIFLISRTRDHPTPI